MADINNTNNKTNTTDQQLDENLKLFRSTRSKSMPPSTILLKKSTKDFSTKMNNNNVNTDRLKMAKEEAEKAIKVFFFFSIILIKFLN